MLEDGLVESSDEKEMSGKSSEPGAAGEDPSRSLLFFPDEVELDEDAALLPFM